MSDNILLNQTISDRLFHPRHNRLSSVFKVVCGDVLLCCYYRELSPKFKTLVLFHGNGEVAGDFVDLFTNLAEMIGFNIFISEYRGYGESTGKPDLFNLTNDVNSIIESIARPPEDLVIFGRSLGSIPALSVINNFPDISGLIIDSGIADLGGYLNSLVSGTGLEKNSKEIQLATNQLLDMRKVFDKFTGASLVIHAKNDRFILVNNAYQLYQWASSPKKIKIFESGNHNTFMYDNLIEYSEILYDFIKSI